MLRDIWTNKWFIGGFGFLIVFSVLCYFWYQHDIASFQQQLSATGDIVFQGDMSQKAQKTVQTDVPLIESLESVENRSESVRDTSVPTEKTTEKTDTFEINTNLTADAPTSPFGFGAYPEVPADYPFQEQLWDNATPEHELPWSESVLNYGNKAHKLKVPCLIIMVSFIHLFLVSFTCNGVTLKKVTQI